LLARRQEVSVGLVVDTVERSFWKLGGSRSQECKESQGGRDPWVGRCWLDSESRDAEAEKSDQFGAILKEII
jgi:hypothetical protein